MSENTDLMNAGITAKERLERIERMLEGIDIKLDTKASQVDFVMLENRVREIELHGTAPAQEAAKWAQGAQARADVMIEHFNNLKIKVYVAIGIANGLLAIGIFFLDKVIKT